MQFRLLRLAYGNGLTIRSNFTFRDRFSVGLLSPVVKSVGFIFFGNFS